MIPCIEIDLIAFRITIKLKKNIMIKLWLNLI